MRSATSKRVILNPGTLNYLGHKNMVEFVLEELIMQNGNTVTSWSFSLDGSKKASFLLKNQLYSNEIAVFCKLT